MCFNYKLSLLTTFLHYSALTFILKSNNHKSKELMFYSTVLTLTTGLIEPLEGIIHYNFEKKGKFIFKKLLAYCIYLQPFLSIISYIFFYRDFKLIIPLLFHYILFKFDPKIKINNEHHLKFFKPSNNIKLSVVNGLPSAISQIFLTLLPLILLSLKVRKYKYVVMFHLVSIFVIKMNYIDGYVPTLWCFITSLSLWIYIVEEKIRSIF